MKGSRLARRDAMTRLVDTKVARKKITYNIFQRSEGWLVSE